MAGYGRHGIAMQADTLQKILAQFQDYEAAKNRDISIDDIERIMPRVGAGNEEIRKLIQAFRADMADSLDGGLEISRFISWIFGGEAETTADMRQSEVSGPECAANAWAETSSEFQTCIQVLINGHLHEIANFKRGISETSSFRDLVEKVVVQHEYEAQEAIKAAERAAPFSFDVSDSSEAEPLWKIGDPSLPTMGGPEHKELASRASMLRGQNDALDNDVERMKGVIKGLEADMLTTLEQLKPCEWGPMEVTVRKQMGTKMREMEAKDVRLAFLRGRQIDNLEQIRFTKIETWKFLQSDKVNSCVMDLENAMRSVGAWWDSERAAALSSLAQDLLEEKVALEGIAGSTWERVKELSAHLQQLEAQHAEHGQQGPWDTDRDDQDIWLQMMKHTFELQVLAWKRNHIRDKQLRILENRWLIARTQKMMQRQAMVDDACLRTGDVSALVDSVEYLTNAIQEQTVDTKQRIANVLCEANEAQEKLRGMSQHHNAETDALRDLNLSLLFDVKVEDTRLAWLRKEQLQTVELAGKLRKTLSDDCFGRSSS